MHRNRNVKSAQDTGVGDGYVAATKLIREWDYTKNILDPKTTALGSNKKAWWVCAKGHKWSATVHSRTSGVGCPYCANRRITPENNLAARFPNLAREWDTERNQVAPTEIFPGTVKKSWWICPEGHSYEASPNKRTNRGDGCPYCSGHKVSEKNSFALAFPHLKAELHPTRNEGLALDDLSVKSNKQVWWQCKRGHEWKTSVGNRTRGTKCPHCNSSVSQSELRIYAELKNLFNGVQLRAKVNRQECDILIAPINFAIEYDGLYWHKKRATKDTGKNRKLAEVGVELLRVREVGLEKIGPDDVVVTPDRPDELFASLKNVVALIAKRFTLTPTENERVHEYLAANGFQYDAEYRSLLDRLPAPPYEESLEARYPEVAVGWHPQKNKTLTPADVAAVSQLKVWWRCAAGHEWQSSVGNRTSGGNCCPYCAHQYITFDNSLAAKRPDLIVEWDSMKNGVSADGVFAYSPKIYWWRCSKGHEFQARPSNRASVDRKKNTGCPYCGGKKVNAENCLAKMNPTLAAEWHPNKNGEMSSASVTQWSNKKAWWKCSQGHEWQAVISSRSGGNGCPYCANRVRACHK